MDFLFILKPSVIMLYKQIIKRRFAYKLTVPAISRTLILLLFIITGHITLMR